MLLQNMGLSSHYTAYHALHTHCYEYLKSNKMLVFKLEIYFSLNYYIYVHSLDQRVWGCKYWLHFIFIPFKILKILFNIQAIHQIKSIQQMVHGPKKFGNPCFRLYCILYIYGLHKKSIQDRNHKIIGNQTRSKPVTSWIHAKKKGRNEEREKEQKQLTAVVFIP